MSFRCCHRFSSRQPITALSAAVNSYFIVFSSLASFRKPLNAPASITAWLTPSGLRSRHCPSINRCNLLRIPSFQSRRASNAPLRLLCGTYSSLRWICFSALHIANRAALSVSNSPASPLLRNGIAAISEKNRAIIIEKFATPIISFFLIGSKTEGGAPFAAHRSFPDALPPSEG